MTIATLLNRLLLISLCLLLTPAESAERTTYYHLDLLGSPVAATDNSGQVVWREEYKPYGERLQQAPASTGNTLWYTGKAHEAPMGLSYFGARWHDPELGRFTGIDPVDVQGENLHSFNRYAYGNNNPYKFTDPDGRNPKLILDFGLNVALNYATTGQFDVLGAVRETVLGALNPLKTAQNVKKVSNIVSKNTVGGLRAAGQKDAHHIIQDAAAKNLPGYKTNAAPGVQLTGPANKVGTPHYNATQVQRQRGTGTYASERRIGYKALRRGGLSRDDARAQIGHTDEYFGGLGVTGSTKMRPVRNRGQ